MAHQIETPQQQNPGSRPEAETQPEDRTIRASNKPLRASPFSWETASRVRPLWRR